MPSATIHSPIGHLKITTDDMHLKAIEFVTSIKVSEKKTALLRAVVKELEEYFAGKRIRFTVPVKVDGTAFQKAVWKAMQSIGHGQSKSYGALAKAIKRPKAFRAVGRACGKNPIPIIIPCHRIKGTNGMGGYSGGVGKKKWLLQHEEKLRMKNEK
ncbi:MAG: methylated-DNA--[protein]-cysteine S-methyltransferase [Candidatus Peribacteraceae bacterium]